MDFGLDQHSCKGKGYGSVTLIWDRWLDVALSIPFLFYVVSISESRHFVCKCYVSRILFKCCNIIQSALYCSFVVMAWQCVLNKITLQHKLCTDTNTVFDIVKATSFCR